MTTPPATASSDAVENSSGHCTDQPDLSSFESLGIPAQMVRNLKDRGICSAFPIQSATIPHALAGRDVCGRAPTGSGKTLAFGIPLVLRAKRSRPNRPRALVLAPTRELAAQISDELQMLADTDQSVATFYGGVGFGNQLRALRHGVDIAVACPGRLADLIKQGHVDLSDVDLVVLDEADRMADMGFLPEVKRLLDACSDKRQTLLFSATLDGDVDVIIKRYMDNPVRHAESDPDSDDSAAEHIFWDVERTGRVDVAAHVIARTGPTVVFCRTKRGADRISRQLGNRGVAAVAIHGDRSQKQRERALDDFRVGRAQAIVATDVAARGIHVDGVTCVIHFDPTDDPKDYVHRSGRTGRAGNSGVVVSFVQPDVRRDMMRQQRKLGRQITIVAPDPRSLPEAPPFTAATPRRSSTAADRGKPSSRAGSKRSKPKRADSRSGNARPGNSRPGNSRPSNSRPGNGRSGNGRPGKGSQAAAGRSSKSTASGPNRRGGPAKGAGGAGRKGPSAGRRQPVGSR